MVARETDYGPSYGGWKHGVIVARLGRVIGNYVDENRLGMTTAAGTGYILHKNPDGKDTVRAPDVGFIAAERVPDNLDEVPDGFVPFAPDLAVEVISPGDDAGELQQKVMEYLRYGTRLVWIVYPKSRTVVVHTPSDTQTLDINGTLDGGEVLPGFTLPVRDIFSRLAN